MILNSKMLWNGRSVLLGTCKYANEYIRVVNTDTLGSVAYVILKLMRFRQVCMFIMIGADSGVVLSENRITIAQ
jgi:hypothetical protein